MTPRPRPGTRVGLTLNPSSTHRGSITGIEDTFQSWTETRGVRLPQEVDSPTTSSRTDRTEGGPDHGPIRLPCPVRGRPGRPWTSGPDVTLGSQTTLGPPDSDRPSYGWEVGRPGLSRADPQPLVDLTRPASVLSTLHPRSSGES